MFSAMIKVMTSKYDKILQKQSLYARGGAFLSKSLAFLHYRGTKKSTEDFLDGKDVLLYS